MNIAGSSPEERTGATITYVLTAIFSWLGALIGWLIWRGKGAYAKDQTTEALNFGITMLIIMVALSVLARIIPAIGFLVWIASLVQLVFGIIAALAANKGENYRFPFALRLVK
ncbi:DUF4870 domain-containing protein [Dyella tabacisoli]|nr:DUF4870 domain-containing protein [Dyella tabacisoli]